MPRISVIIPVYNVEDYLEECLDSVLAQTMPDFEAVCVNDGSTDGSAAILERYAARDRRIKIVSKPNGGLSSARNAGIANASGEYLSFLDSDDTLTPDACQVICDSLDASQAEALTFGAVPYPREDTPDFRWLEEVLSPRDVLFEGFCADLMFKEMSHPYIWRSAVRADALHRTGVRFDESLRFGEDEVFYFALYPRLEKVQLCSAKLLNYRANRSGSLMRQRRDRAWKVSAHFQIVERVMGDWKENGFASQYPLQLLIWTCEFLVADSLSLPDSACLECAQRLKGLWDSCIPEYVLREFKADPVFGEAAFAFVYDQGRLHGFSRKRLLADCIRRSQGRRVLLNRAFDILRS